ncbi:MAG TPA: efflux RND transporter permease subunit, partial [Anaerolineae bacterium]|nr:efflux RND transporter permease subunit [Anaerolineae bacterium]
ITLNSISLVGIALAVGMLLDNSVVVLESIYRHVSLGKDRTTAVIQGTKDVWRSILASTLTTITVFVPFVFTADYLIKVIGRHIGISIVSTLLVSLIVALMLIPAAIHFLLRKPGKSLIFSRVSRKNRLVQLYTLFLKSAIRFPVRTIIGTVAIFFTSILICFSLSLNVSREIDLKEFSLFITMPQGSTIEQTDEVTQELEGKLADIPEKQDVISTIYDTEATLRIILKDDYADINNRTIAQIKSDIQRRIEDFRTATVSLSEPQASTRYGGGSGANPVASLERMFGIGTQSEKVVIKGSDYELLRKVADDIQYYLEELDTVRSANLNISGNRPEIHLFFDNLLMSRHNIALNTVSSELASFQNQVSTGITYKQGTDEYDIVIRNETVEKEKTFEDLQTLPIPSQSSSSSSSASSSFFELGQLSHIVYSYGLSRINRINQEKQIELTYQFEQEVNDSKSYLQQARGEVDMLVASLSVPVGVAVEVVHDESELSEFYFLIGASFLLIYMILASVFESLITPVVIMFTIPLATIGSFWALIFTGNSLFNANSLIGFIILLGVVVNNGILLIDYTRLLRRRNYRRSRALMTAGQARVRPILITAITSIVAMLPLAMGKAEYVTRIGAPFAITVIGGLSLSTLFTLVFIPTIYSAVESALEWIAGLSWKNKLIQITCFVLSCFLIYYYIDSLFWRGVYGVLALIVIPGIMWFIMTSLRRARADYITPDKQITISIRRVVKIYDDQTRFVKEWNKDERYKQLLGSSEHVKPWSLFRQYPWQFPLLGFLVYFIYLYIRSNVWLFILSHAVFFYVLILWTPVALTLKHQAQKTGKSIYLNVHTLFSNLFIWGFPIFSLVLFHHRHFLTGMLIFIGLFWYMALVIFTVSQRLHREKINIMRLSGRFAGLRRQFYRFVTFIPIIGKKKQPFHALDSVTFTITSGMFGLLGPNGAGKTTLMRIICGLLHQSLGTIWVNNINLYEKQEELQGL